MKRFDVIRQTLNSLGSEDYAEGPSLHISKEALSRMMECLNYLVFPEYNSPPERIIPVYLNGTAVKEWTLGKVADVMSAQLWFALLLQDYEQRIRIKSKPTPEQATEADGRQQSSTPTELPTNASLHRQRTLVLKQQAEKITSEFLTARLAKVSWLLRTDAEAVYEMDVAATSLNEVILCYPSIFFMLHQRVAHQLYLLGAPSNFTRSITEMAHARTGIDIHPMTSIGHHFVIDHGTGIVIGATARIGNYVNIYQGVTLGAKSFPVDRKTGKRVKNLPRHPILEDDVTIYANAVVLGRVTIGRGSTIGGNCWVVNSLPPYSTVVQKGNHVFSGSETQYFETGGSGI